MLKAQGAGQRPTLHTHPQGEQTAQAEGPRHIHGNSYREWGILKVRGDSCWIFDCFGYWGYRCRGG
jgi:hypothetical protein